MVTGVWRNDSMTFEYHYNVSLQNRCKQLWSLVKLCDSADLWRRLGTDAKWLAQTLKLWLKTGGNCSHSNVIKHTFIILLAAAGCINYALNSK